MMLIHGEKQYNKYLILPNILGGLYIFPIRVRPGSSHIIWIIRVPPGSPHIVWIIYDTIFFIYTLILGFILSIFCWYIYYQVRRLFLRDNSPNLHFLNSRVGLFTYIKNKLLRYQTFYILWILLTLEILIFLVSIGGEPIFRISRNDGFIKGLINFYLIVILGFILSVFFEYCYYRVKWLFRMGDRPDFRFFTLRGEFSLFIHIENKILSHKIFYIVWFLITLRILIFIIEISPGI